MSGKNTRSPRDKFMRTLAQFCTNIDRVFPDEKYTQAAIVMLEGVRNNTTVCDQLMQQWQEFVAQHAAAFYARDMKTILTSLNSGSYLESILKGMNLLEKWQHDEFNEDSKSAFWSYLDKLTQYANAARGPLPSNDHTHPPNGENNATQESSSIPHEADVVGDNKNSLLQALTDGATGTSSPFEEVLQNLPNVLGDDNNTGLAQWMQHVATGAGDDSIQTVLEHMMSDANGPVAQAMQLLQHLPLSMLMKVQNKVKMFIQNEGTTVNAASLLQLSHELQSDLTAEEMNIITQHESQFSSVLQSIVLQQQQQQPQ